MQWLTKAKKKRRPGERGRGKTPAERQALADAKLTEYVIKERKDLVEKLFAKKHGLELSEPVDPFKQLAEHIDLVRGLMPQVEEMQRPSGMIDWQGLGAGIATALLGLAGSGAFGGAPAAAPAGALGAGETTPQPGAPSSAPTPVAVEVPAVPVAERRRLDPIPGSGPVPFPSRMAHALLTGLTPAEAARVLHGQTGFDVPEVVAVLVQVPDAEVLGYLARMGMKHAPLAGLVRWAEADPEWTVEVVRELRRIRGVAAPAAAA